MSDIPHASPATAPRYARQTLLAEIGMGGQERLGAGRVLLVGCGALGTVLAETLVRAGVGRIRICDRDFVELNNLQRQVLFDEEDLRANLPKAEAARRKLACINSQVQVEAEVIDVNPSNADRLAEGCSLLLDGTDNFETRYLINDLAVKTGRPWVYAAVISTSGLCMPVVPGAGPCLRCVFDEAPPPEMNPTCDTAGVLGTAVNVVASLAATEAIKLLLGRIDELNRGLTSIDVWSGRFVTLNVGEARSDCVCCGQRRFEYLDGNRVATSVSLCGRDAVQINRAGGAIDFAAVEAKLKGIAAGPVQVNKFLLRATLDGYELTLFRDGRAIIKGTSEVEVAKGVFAKYIGA